MSKRRCSACKQYVTGEEMYRANSVQAFCSEECLYAKTAKKPAAFKPSTPRKKMAHDKKAGADGAIPPATRRAVLDRDKSCRFCGDKRDLHVHHVVYRSQGGTNDEHNLIVLCMRHHETVHSNKRKYMPLCQGVIALSYLGRRVSLLQMERELLSSLALKAVDN